ncbi:MAG: hypothetical protein PWQ51_2301 [Methanolobus sp.]|nr:hypothetical protein [Methanolobus sp.]
MEIISLNINNIEYWIEKVQEFVKKFNNKEIEALYQNRTYSMQRFGAGIELSFLAVEGEDIVGMLSAFGNGKQSIWSLALTYVNEDKRLQGIGSSLVAEFEKRFADKKKPCKLTAQCKKSDKYSNIFYLSKDFEFEGWCRAVEEKDDMYVWGKVYK